VRERPRGAGADFEAGRARLDGYGADPIDDAHLVRLRLSGPVPIEDQLVDRRRAAAVVVRLEIDQKPADGAVAPAAQGASLRAPQVAVGCDETQPVELAARRARQRHAEPDRLAAPRERRPVGRGQHLDAGHAWSNHELWRISLPRPGAYIRAMTRLTVS